MGTTATGLRYPEPTDPVNQGAAAIKNLADDVSTYYPAMQVGTVTVALSSGAATVTVTFPRPFSAAPVVLVSCGAITGSVAVLASVSALSATGFSAIMRQMPSGTFSGNVGFYWHATR